MKAALLLLWLIICQTSAHSRPSVTVHPSMSQFLEYEKVSVSCEQFGSGGWKVWRYATDSLEPVVSQCGSGWGTQTSSTCVMKTVKKTDSGVYWCQSKYRDSSNAVNITVTGGSVVLQSPVRPVMEGDDVPLKCSTAPAGFYKDGSHIETEPTGHMTIHNFSRSNEGGYTCRARGGEESPHSWLVMKDGSVPASLMVSHNSSQLFEYENVTLSCGDNSSFHGWKVLRAANTATSGDKLSLQSCGTNWGNPTSSGCLLQTAKMPDSGIYWCESPARQRSNSVEISIRDEPVILQSPVLPVMEGDDVTLHCQSKTPPSNPTAAFYKDGSLLRTEPTGHMTIRHVSRSDEGLYKCHISGPRESPPSWLFVRVPSSTDQSTAFSALSVILHLVKFCLYFICTVLMVSSWLHRPKGGHPSVSMKTSPPSDDDEGSDRPYDDAIANATTEHHF